MSIAQQFTQIFHDQSASSSASSFVLCLNGCYILFLMLIHSNVFVKEEIVQIFVSHLGQDRRAKDLDL
jgi:hypothetical protein